jgi:hypothetical protein
MMDVDICFIQKSAPIKTDFHFAPDDRMTVTMMTMISGKRHLLLIRDSNNSRGSIYSIYTYNIAHTHIYIEIAYSLRNIKKFSFD